MNTLSALFKRHRTIASLSVVLAAYFFFGLQHIGSFLTADEYYWVEERIPKYFEAWSKLDLRKTDINDKPGVSLALVSGPSLLLASDTSLDCRLREGWFARCSPEETSRLYASFRLPILIANALFLVLIFFSVRAFADREIALGTALFTALSPHLLGLSQIVNPDSLFWSSGSAALFAFFAFLRTGKRSFAIWTLLSLTLALLSKYTALMIVFFLPIIVLGVFVLDRSFSPLRSRIQYHALLVISIVPFLLFALFVPELVMPGAAKFRENFLTAGTDSWLPWIGYAALLLVVAALSLLRIPERYHGIVSRVSLRLLGMLIVAFLFAVPALVIARHALPGWDIFSVLPFDVKDITNARYYLDRYLSPFEIAVLELNPLLFALPTATVLLAWYAIAHSLGSVASYRLPIMLLTLFSLSYLVVFGFSNVVATPRYIAILFPIFSFFAAVGLLELAAVLRKKLPTLSYPVLATVVTAAMLGSVFASKPFYANFDNALLPKESLLSHSWGYGGYEAARHLNALPDARNLTIWSDYYGVCEFFVGRCLTAYTFDSGEVRPEYYVLTRRGQIRYMPRANRWEELSGLTAYRYYDRTDPVWILDINGQEQNFVKIFKVE